MKLTSLLGATALFTSMAVLPGVAHAQATQPAEANQAGGSTTDTTDSVDQTGAVTTEADEDTNTVVVTGSRIRRPNDDSPIPITTVTPQDILSQGRVSVGDALNQLPQLRTSLGSQNSTGGLGTRGLNLLDLRGLGFARTLTLINGRRQVGADIINGVFSGRGSSVDINTIPTDLIQRVDIVTGGNSAIYGSDAIAGVVNFVLNDSFDGLQLRGQSGISHYGDAGNQYVSLLAGKNFADGRGNIAINLEFAHQEDYYASGRRNLRQNDAFLVVDTDTTPSNDGVPDRIFFRDIRTATGGYGGLIAFNYANAGAPCGVGNNGTAFTCNFLFNPDGSLVPQTGLRVGIGPNGNFIGGNGNSFREGQGLVLSPDLKRYVANLIAHFEVTPAFVPFIEAKYVRTEAFGSQSGPFFVRGQTLGDGVSGIADFAGTFDRSFANGTFNAAGVLQPTTVNREGVRLDNPFLTPAARATIQAQLTAAINSGVNPNTGTAYGTTANGIVNRNAALAQVAAGTFRFALRRDFLDLGNRDELIRRETYRVVGGVRGEFFDDWRYELSANYGEHKEFNTITSNVAAYQRYVLALDSVRLPNGQIVCRAQVDSRYAGVDRAGNAAQLASDVANCVPINPFGEGSISQAARNYLLQPTNAEGKATQFVATGFVSGDLSELFELPGGPIGFSVGGEYRRETLSYGIDDFTSAGYAFYNALPDFSAPAFEVKEAFGEISIPLIKDVFLLEELTLSGSGRVADYKGGAGTVYAYGGQVTWRPVRDLLLRGNYSQSVRAPYIGSLFTPQVQNFTPAPNDPCAARNLSTGSATRAANCAAAGRPADFDFVYQQSLETRSGGNPNLQAETSKSITLGGVFQPRFIPGLSISADYYDIQVDDVIANVAAQTILNLCYDSATLNNPFCDLFQRAGAGGGPKGEQPFRILEGSLLISSTNFAKFKTRGIDVNAAYNRRFDWGNIRISGVYTHVIQNDQFTNPADPNFKNTLQRELGNPQDRFNISTDVKIGNFTFGHTLRWIGKQYLNTFEDYNALNGQPPQNTDYADLVEYPIVAYHDLRVGYDITDKFNLQFIVVNANDEQPPFGLTGVGAGSGIYDNRGRFFTLQATAKF
jgi:outer membrane receptor protein involved in Fe transport